MNKKIIAVFVIFGLLSLIKQPVCYFPEEVIQIKDPTVCDIADNQRLLEGNNEIQQYYIGNSMFPYIQSGQVCDCEIAEEYKVGDIVSFYSYYNNKLMFIAHRIIKVLPNGQVITKGDNTQEADQNTITQEQIFCKLKEETLLERIMRRFLG